MTDLPTLIRDAREARVVLYRLYDIAGCWTPELLDLLDVLDRIARGAQAAEGMAEAAEQMQVAFDSGGDPWWKGWTALTTALASYHPQPAAQPSGNTGELPQPSAPGHPSPGGEVEPGAKDKRIADLEYKLAVGYQLFGTLASDLGKHDHDRVRAALDYLAEYDGAPDPLPFASFEPEVQAALATARSEGRAEAVPPGWKLVPIHASTEMRVAGGKYLEGLDLRRAIGCVDFVDEVWARMMARVSNPPRASQHQAAARPQDREVKP